MMYLQLGHGLETLPLLNERIISRECLKKQYSDFRVMEHRYLDGTLTLGNYRMRAILDA